MRSRGSASGGRPSRGGPAASSGSRGARRRTGLQAAAATGLALPARHRALRPDRVGQERRRAGVARAARRRGRLGRLGRAVRRPADPDRRARPSGAARRRRPALAATSRSASTSVLAHEAIDEIAATGAGDRRRGHRPLPARRALGPRSCRRRRRRVCASGRAALRQARPRAAHAQLAERDPAAAARVHPNDRRRVVRALELNEAGRLARARRGQALDGSTRGTHAVRRARLCRSRTLDARIGRAHDAMVGRGAAAEARRAWAAPLSETARQRARARGVRDAAARTSAAADVIRPRGGSPATSASGCAGWSSRLRSPPAGPRRRSPMRSSRWDAQGNIYLVAEGELASTAERVRAAVGDPTGSSRCLGSAGATGSRSRSGTPTARRRRCRATAPASQRAGWPSARAPTASASGRRPRGGGRDRRGTGSSSRTWGSVTVGEPEEVEGIRFTTVDVGNPHAVVEGDPAELLRIGPLLETHARFPNRTNVQVAQRLDDGRSRRECGSEARARRASSGSSAVAVAAAWAAATGNRPLPGRRPPGPPRPRPGASSQAQPSASPKTDTAGAWHRFAFRTTLAG